MSTHHDEPTTMNPALFLKTVFDANRAPSAPLDDLVIRFSCLETLNRNEPSDELVPWTATLELPFYDDGYDSTAPVVIPTATFFSFDIFESTSDPDDVLDSLSADIAVFRTLFDPDGNPRDSTPTEIRATSSTSKAPACVSSPQIQSPSIRTGAGTASARSSWQPHCTASRP